MRNLKKILALALVFAMAFTFVASAADFTDAASIGANYVDDVNMLVELGVIGGYPDGSFGPQKNITRAEFAKMAYTLKYGSDSNGDLFAAQKSAFTDVEGNANVAWAKGYINYCANQKIVSGVGNNKFNPQGNITVAEATKMILVILGCDAEKEGFVGANWAANVTAKAIDLGIFEGWTGDPTALATRELVAKLMKNAIFTPVYTYNAYTGIGSQYEFDGDTNPILGSKMGVEFLTGIVIANERYAIDVDADGEPITDGRAGIAKEGESKIYYTYTDEDGEKDTQVLVAPVALADEMIGQEVSVFFKGNKTKNNWYENVEIIGDIMVTADTVVIEAPAIALDIYPNGDEKGNSEMKPYIGFEVDGVEYKIKAAAGAKVGTKGVDYADDMAEVVKAFGDIAWASNEITAGSADLKLTQKATSVFADMGLPVMSTYRLISVDGGETFSYIFKIVDDGSNAQYGAVTSYSEAKGRITINGVGTYDLEEDVEIAGEIAVDDMVVVYRENDIVNIAKVETMTGAVEAINDNGTAVIGGEVYALWADAYRNAELDLDLGDTLADYFTTHSGAMAEGTKYYVYGNLILDIEADATEAVAADYAVILKSTYDEDLDAAYVTLAFADNTQATYEVGKLNIEDRENPYSKKNDKASDFNMNSYFGMVVKYKIMADGKLDLSANDFGMISGRQDTVNNSWDNTTYYASSRYGEDLTIGNVSAAEGEMNVDAHYYAANDEAVLFVIYGNPQYQADGSILRNDDLAPIKAAAYKLANKRDQRGGIIANMYLDDTLVANAYAVSYALNTTKGAKKGIVAAAMTVGAEAANDTGDAADGEAIAYIAASTQKYNTATGEYYLQMTLIDENGLFTAKTIDSPVDFNNDPIDVQDNLGKVVGNYAAGTYVEYALNADGVITNIDNAIYGRIANALPETITTGTNGLYVVNAVSTRGDRLFFLETARKVDDVANAAPRSVKFHEDGYEVITIDDDEYVGETIVTVPARETSLPAGAGNAVIQLDEGEIIRVFSFVVDYKGDGSITEEADLEVSTVKSGTIFGKDAADFYGTRFMFDNKGNKWTYSGSLKKVTGYTGFNSDVAEQEGHYVRILFDIGVKADSVIGDTGNGTKDLTAAANENDDFYVDLVLRVENLKDSVYKLSVKAEGETTAEVYTFDFSNVDLLD